MTGRNAATRILWVLAVAVMLLAAACGGDDGGTAAEPETEAESAGGEEAGDAPETPDLTLSMLPLAHVAPVFVAQEEGYFEEEGLTVETQFAQGGAAIIPAIISGEVDIGYGNYVSWVLAHQEGLEVSIIAENDRAADDHGVYVLPDSPLQEPADLAGIQIAVNTLNNVGAVAISAVLDSEGVDPQSVEFVEVPFPDMAPTLERGQADAVWVVEPFKSVVEGGETQGRLILDLFSGPTEALPVAGWGVTDQFAADNPNTVAAFRRALEKATAQLQSDPETFASILPTYTEITPEVAEAIATPDFAEEIDLAELQRVPDLMHEYGFIDEPVDMADFVAS